MKYKYILISAIALGSNALHAQRINPFFNTVGTITENRHPITLEVTEDVDEDVSYNPLDDSSEENAQTIEQIGRILGLPKRKGENREGSGAGHVLSFYDGERHELTLDNLLGMLDELGLSNRLYVLAQAVLETGNFSSNVCRNYNNLFGLYDSSNNDYFHFDCWEDSVIGYKKFIQNKYNGGNYLEFLDEIGYAEDPDYIQKVANIAVQMYNYVTNRFRM